MSARYRADMDESTRPDSIDPLFRQPYVDVDEWRDARSTIVTSDGGFAGIDTRFSMCLPPAARYEGRFPPADHAGARWRTPRARGDR